MFSWFLKLLGIDEDRPASSNNSLLNTTSSQAAAHSTSQAQAQAQAKSKPEPEPAPKAEEPKVEKMVKEEPAAVKPVAEKKKTEQKPKQQAKTKTKPKPKPKKTSAKPAAKSLADEFPGLKVNFVKVLTEAGFDTKEAIGKATDKELLALKGIGQATIKILRK